MIKRIIVAALAACTVAAPAVAALDPAAFKAVADKPTVALDPAKSYLIVQTLSGTAALTFVRRPEKADIDDYLARRAAALAKAHAKWAKKHAEWQGQAANWDRLSSQDRRGAKRPVEPVEPTDLNLAFAAIEQENMVTIGPFNRFAKGEGGSTFVHMVPPGRYVFYGPINIAAPIVGTCLCMGSIEFEVKPGQIVNAGIVKGNWIAERAKAKAEGKPVPASEMDLPEGMNSISWEVPVAGAAIDPRLSAYRIVAADLRAAGRVPNYFGVNIDRMTPIPGVLDYDRDKILDMKAGGKPVAAPSPPS